MVNQEAAWGLCCRVAEAGGIATLLPPYPTPSLPPIPFLTPVFMLYITGRHEASSTVLQGSLNLVDLAGRWVVAGGGEGGYKGGGG